MDDDPVAERGSGIEDGAGVNAAALANLYALADDRARLDAASGADHGVSADHRAGTDGDIFAEPHMRTDDRRGMNSGGGQRGSEQFGRLCEPEPRLSSRDDALD